MQFSLRNEQNISGQERVFALFYYITCRASQKAIHLEKIVRVHLDGFEVLVHFVVHLERRTAHQLIFIISAHTAIISQNSKICNIIAKIGIYYAKVG